MSRHCMQTNECLWSWKQPHFLSTEISGTNCKKKENKEKKYTPRKREFLLQKIQAKSYKIWPTPLPCFKVSFYTKRHRILGTLTLLYWLRTPSGDVGHSSTWCDEHDFTIQHRDASSVLSKFPQHLWICYPSRVYLHLEYVRLHIMRF